ncbi:MAG: DUF6335 family protein [Blastocatellia bacterium]
MKKNNKRNDKARRYDPGATDFESLVKDNLAEAGARRMERELGQYNSVSPELTAGDVDADWQNAEENGEETPGGHAATPDQNNVDELGRALGIEFQDNQELRTHTEVLAKRDRHRWELNKHSADGDSI